MADEFSATGHWDTALVSAEGLRRADPQRLEEVRTLLPGFSRVVVIVYLRQPDHFIESFFIENLKNGAWHGSFGEFVDHCQKAGELDFSRQIGIWQAAFPGCDTVARPFDRSQWPEGDLIKDFFRAIGRKEVAGLDCLRPVTEVNRTPNGGALSLLREMNRRLQTERDRTRSFGFAAVLPDPGT